MTLDPTLRDKLARAIHDAACRCGGPIHHRHYLTAADKAAELLTTQPAPIVLPTVEEVAETFHDAEDMPVPWSARADFIKRVAAVMDWLRAVGPEDGGLDDALELLARIDALEADR